MRYRLFTNFSVDRQKVLLMDTPCAIAINIDGNTTHTALHENLS